MKLLVALIVGVLVTWFLWQFAGLGWGGERVFAVMCGGFAGWMSWYLADDIANGFR